MEDFRFLGHPGPLMFFGEFTEASRDYNPGNIETITQIDVFIIEYLHFKIFTIVFVNQNL